MTDEKAQGIAATEYVYQLEQEIERLKDINKECQHNTKISIVNELMKREPFKTWLQYHDDRIYEIERQDWTGVK